MTSPMTGPAIGPVAVDRPPVTAAARAAVALRRELERYGITADAHEGYGLALVSVCADLVVWCGGSYVWWAGGNSAGTGRRLYLSCPLDAPHAAAQLVAARYQRLRVSRPYPAAIGEVPRAGTGSGPGGGVAACRGVPASGREMR